MASDGPSARWSLGKATDFSHSISAIASREKRGKRDPHPLVKIFPVEVPRDERVQSIHYTAREQKKYNILLFRRKANYRWFGI
eukprot:gene12146-8363_t